MSVQGRVRLSDLRPISADEFARASAICKQVRLIVESRPALIAARSLDPEIALPSPNWQEETNTIHDLYRLVVAGRYEVIDKLRLYTQPFTGYQLAAFTMGTGKMTVPYPLPADFDDQVARACPHPDRWVARFNSLARQVPEDRIVSPPRMLGEIGWDVGGRVVNYDTRLFQERVNLLHAAGVIDWIRDRAASAGSVNLLEIGAGYGGLACTLKRLVPQANYYICDLPESLLFSSLYLGLVCPQVPHTIHDGSDTPWQGCRDGGFTYIPNFLFDDFLKSGLRVDLALNTLSLSEMSPKQIRYYCQHVSRLVGDTGVFFQENYDNENVPRCLKESFAHGRRVLPDSLFGLRGAEVWANTRLSELLPAPAFGVRVRRQARSLLSGVWLSFKVQALLGPRVCSRVAALATSQPRLFAALRGAYGWCERLAGTGGVWRSGARR